MKTLNFNLLLGLFLMSGTLFFTSCERNSILEIDEDIEEVVPEETEGESEVLFQMRDTNTDEILINIQESLESAIQTFNVYGIANSGSEVDPSTGDTTYYSTFAVGVADSIQILWETNTKLEPHMYSFDANDPDQGELSYIIINPVTDEANYIFTMKNLDLTLKSIGGVDDLMSGVFEGEIRYSDLNNPDPGQYRNVLVEFSVPRYQ